MGADHGDPLSEKGLHNRDSGHSYSSHTGHTSKGVHRRGVKRRGSSKGLELQEAEDPGMDQEVPNHLEKQEVPAESHCQS